MWSLPPLGFCSPLLFYTPTSLSPPSPFLCVQSRVLGGCLPTWLCCCGRFNQHIPAHHSRICILKTHLLRPLTSLFNQWSRYFVRLKTSYFSIVLLQFLVKFSFETHSDASHIIFCSPAVPKLFGFRTPSH